MNDVNLMNSTHNNTIDTAALHEIIALLNTSFPDRIHSYYIRIVFQDREIKDAINALADDRCLTMRDAARLALSKFI
jgi:hypothetical protein